MKLATPSATKALLGRFGLRPTKSLGQHFLVDSNVLGNIMAAADVGRDDYVVEVGPGIGALTVELAEAAGRVLAIEFDRKLIAVLEAALSQAGHTDNVEIVRADALKVSLREVTDQMPGKMPGKMVSNLPYNIAAPLLIEYVSAYPEIRTYVVMVQREIGERILAQPGHADYGSFTVRLSYLADARKVAYVSRTVFLPPPRVDSMVIRLDRLDTRPDHRLFRVVEAAFAQRRKTIGNALEKGLELPPGKARSALEASGIDQRRRGETLSLGEFIRVAGLLAGDLQDA